MTTPAFSRRPGCAWCSSGDWCGVEDAKSDFDCPIAAVDAGKEPTNADIIRLLHALMTGVNQRFAQVMLLINHHAHKPENGR